MIRRSGQVVLRSGFGTADRGEQFHPEARSGASRKTNEQLGGNWSARLYYKIIRLARFMSALENKKTLPHSSSDLGNGHSVLLQ